MRLVLLLLGAALLALPGCGSQPDDDDGVLTGECVEEGATNCVSGDTIQYCTDGAWGDPRACPPENVGSEFPLEVQTYCSEGGCRPGG